MKNQHPSQFMYLTNFQYHDKNEEKQTHTPPKKQDLNPSYTHATKLTVCLKEWRRCRGTGVFPPPILKEKRQKKTSSHRMSIIFFLPIKCCVYMYLTSCKPVYY